MLVTQKIGSKFFHFFFANISKTVWNFGDPSAPVYGGWGLYRMAEKFWDFLEYSIDNRTYHNHMEPMLISQLPHPCNTPLQRDGCQSYHQIITCINDSNHLNT